VKHLTYSLVKAHQRPYHSFGLDLCPRDTLTSNCLTPVQELESPYHRHLMVQFKLVMVVALRVFVLANRSSYQIELVHYRTHYYFILLAYHLKSHCLMGYAEMAVQMHLIGTETNHSSQDSSGSFSLWEAWLTRMVTSFDQGPSCLGCQSSAKTSSAEAFD
jgi:hypothetical protein